MAIGKRERELLQSFWDKHKTLFTAALTAMSTDENSSEEERQDFKKMLESVQSLEEGKKYYRYQVNGEGKYPCGQVVVKIIEMYVSMNSSISLDEINNKFEKFHKPFAVPLQNAITINETPNKKGRCNKRYFTEYPITLVDNNQIAITSQWGNDKNFENLIEFTKSIIPKLDVQRVK